MAGFMGAAGFVGFVGVVGVAGIIHRKKKKFFLFLPSHPHKCGSSALFIGVSRVRVSVRVELLPSHLPSHYPHTSGTGSILSGFLFTEFNKSTRKVQLSGTDSSA